MATRDAEEEDAAPLTWTKLDDAWCGKDLSWEPIECGGGYARLRHLADAGWRSFDMASDKSL